MRRIFIVCSILAIMSLALLLPCLRSNAVSISDNSSYKAQSSNISTWGSREGALAVYTGVTGWTSLEAGGSGQYLQTLGQNPPQWQTLGQMHKATITPIVGASSNYSTENTTTPGTARLVLMPVFGYITASSMGSENITAAFTTYFSDNTSATFTKTFTEDGTYTLTAADMFSLWLNGAYIYTVGYKAKSTSGTPTGSVTFYLGAIAY